MRKVKAIIEFLKQVREGEAIVVFYDPTPWDIANDAYRWNRKAMPFKQDHGSMEITESGILLKTEGSKTDQGYREWLWLWDDISIVAADGFKFEMVPEGEFRPIKQHIYKIDLDPEPEPLRGYFGDPIAFDFAKEKLYADGSRYYEQEDGCMVAVNKFVQRRQIA